MESGTPAETAIQVADPSMDGGKPSKQTMAAAGTTSTWMYVSAVLALALVCMSCVLMHEMQALGPKPLTITQQSRWDTWNDYNDISISPDCVLPLGGGGALQGGNFPHFQYSSCQMDLSVYLQKFGLYYAQVSHVAQAAIGYISSMQKATRDDVFVFDIDETVLSNADEWSLKHPALRRIPFAPQRPQHTQHGWLHTLHTLLHKAGLSWFVPSRFQQIKQQEEEEARATRAAQAEFAHYLSFHHHRSATQYSIRDLRPAALKGVDAGDKPPLEAVRELYYFLIAHNYSVAFITGRKEAARAFTARNLATAGYGEQCGPGVVPSLAKPCYVALHLRDNSDDRPASVYKPERRMALQAAGYTVVGNIGDQFSDLDGLHGAASNWKLPNSMYYIL